MALIESINSAINGFVWGVPMLVLLVGTGILMTLRTVACSSASSLRHEEHHRQDLPQNRSRQG